VNIEVGEGWYGDGEIRYQVGENVFFAGETYFIHEGGEAKRGTALAQMDKLELLGAWWAACYTHGHCTYGARTT
jgi:hypothetical protein